MFIEQVRFEGEASGPSYWLLGCLVLKMPGRIELAPSFHAKRSRERTALVSLLPKIPKSLYPGAPVLVPQLACLLSYRTNQRTTQMVSSKYRVLIKHAG